MRSVVAAALSALAFGAMSPLTGCSPAEQGFDTGVRNDTSSSDATTDVPVNYNDVQAIQDTNQFMLTPDSACAQQVADTQRAPMNLLFVLDRSGSMSDNGKWAGLVAAMHHLIDTLNTMSPDARVGITFFPSGSNPGTETSYQHPAVAIDRITNNRSTLDAVLDATSPDGNTPMACAMIGSEGMGGYLEGLTVNGSRSVILVTDGDPTDECSGSNCSPFDINCLIAASNMSQIRIQATAARAFMASPPIRTYVVATPEANAMFLSTVAVNGGTRRAPGCESTNTCHYSLGSGTFEQDLNRALDEIRGRAATCEFQITANTTNADPNLVNVFFTPAPGQDAELVHRDESHANGWDWSNGMSSVVLYGPACDAVLNNSTGGNVQILFGCPPG